MCAFAAAASFAANAAPDPDDIGRPLLGERFRYPKTWLVPRTLADVAAIPANVPWWAPGDWAFALAIGSSVGFLMAPLDPSLDVRIQRWIDARVSWRRTLWTPVTEVAVWGAVGAALAGTWLAGRLLPAPPLLEIVSLMCEAYALAQVYQLAFKLSIGREGPKDGDGLGEIRGPLASFRLFPAGTPSGHVAIFYALLGVLTSYVELPAVAWAAQLAGLLFSATIVVTDYHFVSDVLWGATLGYALGGWVVRHRASTWRYDGAVPVRRRSAPVAWIVPAVDLRRGGAGLAVGLAF